jgi:hypothetical protein
MIIGRIGMGKEWKKEGEKKGSYPHPFLFFVLLTAFFLVFVLISFGPFLFIRFRATDTIRTNRMMA